MVENINHPKHYGSGANDPYEAIKVIEAWGCGFNDGNSLKYIARAGKKDPNKKIEDIEKAIWYLKRHLENLKAAQQVDGITNGEYRVNYSNHANYKMY